MVICFYCPTGHPLSVNAALAGKRVRCGLCGQTAIVPIPQTGPQSGLARRPVSPPPKLPKLPVAPRGPINNPNSKSSPAIRPIKPISKTIPVAKANPSTTTPNLTPVVKASPTPDMPVPDSAAKSVTNAAVPILPVESLEPILAEFAEPSSHQAPNIVLTADACETCPADAKQVLLLAGGIALAALAMVLPVFAMGHARIWHAPIWTQCVVLLTAMQLAYAIWLASAPDWTTVRVMTIVCTITAALYAVVMAMTLVTPINYPLILGLGEARRGAPLWCLLMLVLMSGLSWACSRVAGRWQRGTTLSVGDTLSQTALPSGM